MAFNVHYDVLKVAGATVSQTSPDLRNEWGRGLKVYINMTAVGTGSVTYTVQGKDTSSGQYYTILATAAIIANGFTVLTVYPGAPVTANVSVSDLLPYTWRILATANNANPTTYSVGVDIIE